MRGGNTRLARVTAWAPLRRKRYTYKVTEMSFACRAFGIALAADGLGRAVTDCFVSIDLGREIRAVGLDLLWEPI